MWLDLHGGSPKIDVFFFVENLQQMDEDWGYPHDSGKLHFVPHFFQRRTLELSRLAGARMCLRWRRLLLRLPWAKRKSRCGGPWCREVGHLGIAMMEGWRLIGNAGSSSIVYFYKEKEDLGISQISYNF